MSVTLHIFMNAYNAESIFSNFPSKVDFTTLFLFTFSSVLSHTLVPIIVNGGQVAQRISNTDSVKPVR